jgi:hypothetical protein
MPLGPVMRLRDVMNPDFEDQLRKALRPVDPDEGFAERVMSRVDSTSAAQSRHGLLARFRGWPAALAASVVLATALTYAWQVDRERRGLEARRQLLEALHITGQKLDVAYRGVMRESAPSSNDDAGA